jgi:hypothetical protein
MGIKLRAANGIIVGGFNGACTFCNVVIKLLFGILALYPSYRAV